MVNIISGFVVVVSLRLLMMTMILPQPRSAPQTKKLHIKFVSSKKHIAVSIDATSAQTPTQAQPCCFLQKKKILIQHALTYSSEGAIFVLDVLLAHKLLADFQILICECLNTPGVFMNRHEVDFNFLKDTKCILACVIGLGIELLNEQNP